MIINLAVPCPRGVAGISLAANPRTLLHEISENEKDTEMRYAYGSF